MKKNILILLWAAAVFFLPQLSYVQIQLFMGTTITLFTIAAIFYTLNKVLAFVLSYFIIISTLPIYFPVFMFKGFDVPTMVGLSDSVSTALIFILALSLPFVLLKKEQLELKPLFLNIALIDSIVILYKTIFHFQTYLHSKYGIGREAYFLLNNAGIDGSFISCILPFAFELPKPKKYLYLIPMVLTLIATYSSSSGVGFMLAVLIYYRNIWSIPIGLAGLAGAYFCKGYWHFVTGSGRLGIWKLMWKYFLPNVNHWIGRGLGTWQMFGPWLQIQDAIRLGQTNNYIEGFTWLHNDWLQVMFEAGFLGLALIAILFFHLLWRTRQTKTEFTALATFGALALIQMPLRHFLFAFLGAYLVFISVHTQPDNKNHC